MSRSIAEIYNDLNQVKSNMSELNSYVTESGGDIKDNAKNLVIDATSGSKVAEWRLWLWIMAVASWVNENIFDAGIAQIISILNVVRPHTLRWYEQETRKWQYGHVISWINDDHYGYINDDIAARIVTDVSASEDNGFVVIKAIKKESNLPAPLTELEKQSLINFWSLWKDAGVKVNVVSLPANVLDIQAIVVRDRLLLSEDGTLIRDSSVNTLQLALQSWLDNLQFNTVIRVTDIEQAAKSAEGIVDFVITFLWIADYTSITWEQVDREIIPSSGFAKIDYNRSVFTYINE